jgi:hypothetical protein
MKADGNQVPEDSTVDYKSSILVDTDEHRRASCSAKGHATC